jgi:RNA polymerase sigma-70 factor (ECF subfamily)
MSEAPTNPASDEKLMLAFVQGFPEALNELYRRYQQPIHGFFRRRIADSSRAEELTQETFLALLRAANRYEPRALFRTYLYAIALKILRAYRRKTIFRAAFLGPSDTVPDPAQQDATEMGLWVRRAVAQLESTDREILLLREFEQLSYAEIADLLHLPINTVRSRLFRARSALRELLEPSSSLAATHTVTSAASASDSPQIVAQKGQRA